MKCYKCSGTYQKHIGSLSLHDKFIGNYEVFNVEYYKCENCGNLLFPQDTAIKIEKKEQECRDSLIKRLPIEEFIFASDAAKILNISRQALHKHIRIRRGFIYSIVLDGKRLYHKKSVYLFKEQGDGRFPLVTEAKNISVQYIGQKYKKVLPRGFDYTNKKEIGTLSNVLIYEQSTTAASKRNYIH